MDESERECLNGGGVKVAPWPPRQATDKIRAYAKQVALDLSYKLHAKQRLAERDINTTDVLHVLRTGFVYVDGEPATQPGFFRYAVEGSSPNTGGRSLRIIVIPSPCRAAIKVVTVMWVDEA